MSTTATPVADPGRHAAVAVDARGIATLTISEAGSLNILGTPVIAALTEAVRTLAADPRVRVLILRGTGDKGFVGGADIKEMAGLTRDSAERFISGLRALCDAVRHCPVPVIARMPGWCLGGGLELALACDLRIAGDNANLGMPEVKVGIPSVIHAALMPRLIGNARTAWMLLTGELCDAAQALSWGWCIAWCRWPSSMPKSSGLHCCWQASGRRSCASRSGCCANGRISRSIRQSPTASRNSAVRSIPASRSVIWRNSSIASVELRLDSNKAPA
ncbi:3-hydroxybutyryl-CoA dehydratase, putative [Cupriavidus gilardii CR3]|nr:3-hydroxybutyryl-CoA dehydratase, putative [Cupriavidus gilardii CR3]